jgi:hypothetical protein
MKTFPVYEQKRAINPHIPALICRPHFIFLCS